MITPTNTLNKVRIISFFNLACNPIGKPLNTIYEYHNEIQE